MRPDESAISSAAKSLVLLGDPQQLAQPSKGIHPDGAEKSALSHFLGDQQTVEVDKGVLLDKTWRMHPDVCSYVSQSFYDGRLSSVADCSAQKVLGEGELAGAGVRFIGVEHAGNKTSSIEEAKRIERCLREVVGADWTNRKGDTQSLSLDDVLVVAPYNAQVQLLKRVLPTGARIGTVDKFQWLEGVVVFYSLCASSTEDISRGMDLLYSANRLNVAVSRARCLSVIVGSPSLLTIEAKTPDQARLANNLCRYVEMAAV